jgi:hypothetical protein
MLDQVKIFNYLNKCKVSDILKLVVLKNNYFNECKVSDILNLVVLQNKIPM